MRNRRLAAEKDWMYTTLFPIPHDSDYVDAAHPGAQGNRKMADHIVAVLNEFFTEIA